MLAPDARADTVTYTISSGNAALSGFTGPYATVTVDLTSSTTAKVTFNSLTNGGYTYLMGDGSSADVNVNLTGAETVAIGGFSASNSIGFIGATPTAAAAGSANSVDGQGSFNETTTLGNFALTSTATTISFTLTLSGGTWANAANVLAANSNGNVAAVHVGPYSTSCTNTTDVGCTGVGTSTGFAGTTPAPLLGAGLPGLIVACGGLLALARRRRALAA
jgi:hypothetical protein